MKNDVTRLYQYLGKGKLPFELEEPVLSSILDQTSSSIFCNLRVIFSLCEGSYEIKVQLCENKYYMLSMCLKTFHPFN